MASALSPSPRSRIDDCAEIYRIIGIAAADAA
jgi:hypothetical protein